MKSLITKIILPLLITVSAKADLTSEKDFISFGNFGMQALTIKKNKQGYIAIIKAAILYYGDNNSSFKTPNLDKVASELKSEKISALVLQFNTKDCNENSEDSNIFTCSNASAPVYVAKITNEGEIIKVDGEIGVATNVSVDMAKIYVQSTNYVQEYYKAFFRLSLRTSDNKWIYLGRMKSNLDRKIVFNQ